MQAACAPPAPPPPPYHPSPSVSGAQAQPYSYVPNGANVPPQHPAPPAVPAAMPLHHVVHGQHAPARPDHPPVYYYVPPPTAPSSTSVQAGPLPPTPGVPASMPAPLPATPTSAAPYRSGGSDASLQLRALSSTTTSVHSSTRGAMEKPPSPMPPLPVGMSAAPAPSFFNGSDGANASAHAALTAPQFTPLAVKSGPVAQYGSRRQHSAATDNCHSRGRIVPVAVALKDVLDKSIDEVDPKAVLRRSRTLRKKIRVAWYHRMRSSHELTPTERVKAERLPEFEAALTRLDETARKLGLMPATDEAVLQEGDRLMLLAKEDLALFWQTGPGNSGAATIPATGLDVGLRSFPERADDEDEDGEDGGVGDDRAALYRKFVQSAAFHAVKMRRLHAQAAATPSLTSAA